MTYASHQRLLRILAYGAAAIASAALFALLYNRGLVNLLIDAQSHMTIASQVIWSPAAGLSQLSFWPPLIHVFLLPAVLLLPSSIAYITGSFLILLPVLLACAYFSYGIARLCGVGKHLSLLSAFLIVAHPFMQYFTASAMTEIPLAFSVMGATYFALKWRESDTLMNLFLFAAFVAISVTARYEGALLVPISTLFVICGCIAKKYTLMKSRAILLIFVFIALLGAAFVMLYSLTYSGGLFDFMSLGTDRVFDKTIAVRGRDPVELAILAWNIFVSASSYMHGFWFVAVFPVAAAIVLLRHKWYEIIALLMLLAPAMFVLLLTSIGRNHIYVPELPATLSLKNEPFGLFDNTRYALTWAGALSTAIVLGIHQLSSFGGPRVRGFVRISLSAAAIGYALFWFCFVAFVTDFSTIRLDITSVKTTAGLIDDYDWGYVLILRQHNVSEMYSSGISTDSFVTESVFPYFDQAMKEPWLFTRWVAVRHGSDTGSFSRMMKMLQLEATPEFQHYYELIQSSPVLRIYRLRDNVLRQQAIELGYDPSKIPSLNAEAPWKPRSIYDDIKAD
jgi:hypothetical protein